MRAATAYGLAAALLTIVVLVALSVGKFPVSPGTTFAILWNGIAGTAKDLDPTLGNVIWNVRLPRVMAGLCVGAVLAAAGASYQGVFRNPLVSPDILGVSAGASLGAVLGIFLSLPVLAIQGLGFMGGLFALGVVYAVGLAVRGRDPVLTLVLAGMAIAALLAAGISLLKILADPYDQLPAITHWLLGSLASVTNGDLLLVVPSLVLGVAVLHLLRWRINLLSLGDDEARALGVETRLLRPALIVAATLITSASVSISGVIGWIGLVIPHMARMLVGPDFRVLLPASLFLGAAFLVVIDTVARTVSTVEVPLGILTAVIGAPFFLALLATGRAGWS
ncbi:iron ABC transporter permease [Rhizobium sp. TRM96647]|uniref:FecCD family ABC transporter permease n=1 Tax=unclassified Rhizobium TaxID=2613769 RepID=UPI0021E8AF4B|nr:MULTISPECIES: iron ABC transporter permease [unclassified Rhizobium]MCV3736019.1 iron ABC transporter permease [Rhizobium sp. TRM96647]MCV3758319.1 iron ABC transporter permease [Rhizobium sp. TRM96650]